MTDLQCAIQNLGEHSICLCRDGKYITDDGKGISPMMKFIAEGKELSGYCAADVIVGKAAALLFAKAGIKEVYGKTMSKSAVDFLKTNAIPYSYAILTEKIINRSGTDICPMEKTVAQIDEPEQAYTALKTALENMKK